ncbi:carboxypeptidase regulatory-like domain-containing protein [Granulicella sp. L60]|uniref:carboxypeptidase regulatory-like domain-containing protein n=1 Tax=Granulicella sp. L60 TaxID=1641866 RepID=UPI00131C155E|nr:carboxypeptidase regulatory-like domain-containing protein [Granulicella sp. L60]
MNCGGSLPPRFAHAPQSAGTVASRTSRRPLLFSLVVVMLLLGGGFLRAQQITGAIAGTVADPLGAVVPSASIVATNTETGFVRTATSDSTGAYAIQYLPIGNYTVAVTAPGFKKFIQENLIIAVDVTQPLNVTLGVGMTSETVTVTDTPPLINTTTETLGRTVTPDEINKLPLVNRNAYQELSLIPGVQSNSSSMQTNSGGSPNFVLGVPSTQVIINGGVDGGVPMVSFYLDGGVNMTGLRNYGNALPNPDALEEFRVETSNYSAQYGKMSGAVVTAVTKSGTNQFHGSAFEFVRNTDLNAQSWGSTINLPYHRNQFGGVIGGPIKRDKAFFLFSYAGLRQTVGQLLNGAVVPTALERVGDFTQSAVKPNFPGTTTPISGTNTSVNCQGVTVGCIPAALLDPTAANILKTYVPQPNAAGNNWVGNYTTPTTQDEYLGKYDQAIGDHDHIQASYFTLKSVSGAFGGASSSANIPFSVNQSNARQQDFNISDVHTFNGSKANQVWFTVTRVAGGRVNLPATSLGDLGSSFTIQGPKALPWLEVSGYFNAGGALAGPVSTTNFYGLRDVFSMTLGRHTLNFGGEASLEKDAIVGNLYNFGIFTFATSAPTTTKNALADFVTGQVNTMEQDVPYHGLMNYFYFAGFVQDGWKISPRLTANLGLRYDVQESPVESSNLTDGFVPGQQSTVVPSAPKGVVYPGDKGIPRGIAGNQLAHVSPRVGLVFDPFGDGKTALRAGAGIFYGSTSANEWNQPANAQPFAVRQTFSSITSLTNVYGNPASFPNGDPFPYTYNPANPRFLPAASVEAIDPNYKWPVSYQFNVAVEQQMPGGVSLQTAYVANFVRHVPFGIDGNNPVWAAGANTGQASINARRPYDPGVLGQVILITSGQTANYNSLQVSAHKQLTHTLLLNGFYVWSKSMWSANSSAIGLGTAQNFSDLAEERGPSDNDRRNVSNISGIWSLDYYHGENGWKKQLANGWKLSAIGFFQSGTPFTITTGSDNNDDSYNNDRPNLVPGVNPFLSAHRSRSVSALAWFNKAAFTPNGAGKPGGIGPGGADGNTPRDFLRAPGYRDIDVSLQRDFQIRERLGFQLKVDSTNVFNMVSLNAPTATLSSANDGKITGAAPNRIIQLGGRFTF